MVKSGDHRKFVSTTGFNVFAALQTVFTDMDSGRSSVSPKAIVGRLSAIARHFRVGRQEDSHEFLRYLLEGMQRNCLASVDGKVSPKVAQTTMVHAMFGGHLHSMVKCTRPHCKYESNTFDAFLDLSLEITKCDSVNKALRHFTAEETLEGDNAYRCSKCKHQVRATKSFSIYQSPLILTIQLKRFDYFRGGKINRHVEFTEEIKLDKFMSTEPEVSERPVYDLYAVLVHAGHSMNSGHYYCYIKAPNGLWYWMNDDSVQQVSVSTVLKQSAYILFYKKRAAAGKAASGSSSTSTSTSSSSSSTSTSTTSSTSGSKSSSSSSLSSAGSSSTGTSVSSSATSVFALDLESNKPGSKRQAADSLQPAAQQQEGKLLRNSSLFGSASVSSSPSSLQQGSLSTSLWSSSARPGDMILEKLANGKQKDMLQRNQSSAPVRGTGTWFVTDIKSAELPPSAHEPASRTQKQKDVLQTKQQQQQQSESSEIKYLREMILPGKRKTRSRSLDSDSDDDDDDDDDDSSNSASSASSMSSSESSREQRRKKRAESAPQWKQAKTQVHPGKLVNALAAAGPQQSSKPSGNKASGSMLFPSSMAPVSQWGEEAEELSKQREHLVSAKDSHPFKRKKSSYDIEYDFGRQKKVRTKEPLVGESDVNPFQQRSEAKLRGDDKQEKKKAHFARFKPGNKPFNKPFNKNNNNRHHRGGGNHHSHRKGTAGRGRPFNNRR